MVPNWRHLQQRLKRAHGEFWSDDQTAVAPAFGISMLVVLVASPWLALLG
ncbi:MAG: hypothetical protein O3A00_02415 [Planctomycetota bacterium]|nr:hypothetical protein [Planctomycetota bacterium]